MFEMLSRVDFVIGVTSGLQSGSKFVMLEAEREETKINNHKVSESIRTGVMEENLMIFSLKNETVIEVRKGTSLLERKVVEAVNGDVGVRRRDVRVKGKGLIGNFGLKSIGRVLLPNNGGSGFVSKKNTNGFGMGVLLGRVGNEDILGQKNFKTVPLMTNSDKLKHAPFRANEIELHGTIS
ncbi:hypothetical protein J1N35_010888 [Gossypium stocksii]|uniref:Uncharacterized protein n=1 Tax=Gossypium stocksii TaxID=47602 RepID=A0A9D3W362_9ROSI|nr:hypothetical protein J1N35_010888 [Gossypium stocksii]